MKHFLAPLASLGVGGCVLMSLALPAIAQSERFPTDAEIAPLIQHVQQIRPDFQAEGYYTDLRTLAEKWVISEFANAWADVNPAIAPYLGKWTFLEASLYIYPATALGEVCVLEIYLGQGEFYTGQVRDGKLYTTNNLVFLVDGDIISGIYVVDNQPGIYDHANPQPLPDPSVALGEDYPELVSQFAAADCVTGLPSSLVY